MGIDYSGGMIIGELGSKLDTPDNWDEDLTEYAEENGMTYMSQYYDCDEDWRIYGFDVPDIPVSEINQKWIDEINELANKFEKLFGVPARLIGTQNIW